VGTKDEDWEQQGLSSQVNSEGFLVGTKDEDWNLLRPSSQVKSEKLTAANNVLMQLRW